MIHVIAFITAKPGRREEVLHIFRDNIPAVLAEDGCVEYSAAVDVPGAEPRFGADIIVVIEKWDSQEALQAHAASPHMVAYRANTHDLVEHTVVHVLDPAS